MLELISDQAVNAQGTVTVSPTKPNATLKLVVSNPTPLQKSSSSQIMVSNGRINSLVTAEVSMKGPCLYEMILQDLSHYLTCDLILEVEERNEKYEGGTVVCHFPTLSIEELNDFVEEDQTLYSILMIQFQIKILGQLLLFCAAHHASTLIIFADDMQADALDIYQDFLTYKDQTITHKGEKTEMVIPADRETFKTWGDFVEKITIDFRQTLWREQRYNPIIRRYLKNHPLG